MYKIDETRIDILRFSGKLKKRTQQNNKNTY